ncbi:tRNA adenosine(34) deaminase TadA [Buchnera aphidicola]|uniref:tRNA-specific adenosine deaminase n=1 Tax=Buchnera aphidicola (Anoecia oenotherae) TaxID=1241833 RepID=A0A4D6XV16_9GAMM|nr:tRNA adenosine(34) deaminase TadA [Buchnera aphidicola]QCI19329.1 tRNA-specific adenosine deaminase [Buchnera aphidicola (Anoecia oenotherae)]
MFNFDYVWMKHAIKLAKLAEKNGEVPVGAVLVLDRKIIGSGYNKSICNYDPTSHAEILALREGGKKIKNYRLLETTLYVTLKPCMMCLGAIINGRVKRLVYGASNTKIDVLYNFLYKYKEKNTTSSLQIKKGVFSYICKHIILNFFKKKRI